MKTKFRNLLTLIFGLVLLVSIFSSVSALGVTPARTIVDYSPGKEETISFSVVNTENKNMDIVVYVQGELNQSVYLQETSFSMSSSESSKQMSYTYRLPSSLRPGPHQADIVILQLPERGANGQAFVGAAVAVATQLVVNVPYPGKYAQSDLNIVNPGQGEEATFIIPVVSLGEQDLARVQANIDIYNRLGEKVASFNTAEVSVPSGQRSDIVSKWKADVPVGEYLAKATLIYDGETLTLEKQFTVGSATLELQQIQVRDFSLGEIAKFEMLVENKWSDRIVGVYAETQVYNKDNEVIADFKSPTYDIASLEKSNIVSYWDTAGIRTGTYDTTVYLRYGDKSSQQNLQLKVEQSSITAVGLGFVISESSSRGGSGSIVTILVVVIVLLVLINLAWFLVLRKRLKR